MKITFCGAAGGVTGESASPRAGKLKVLLDCGLFQGHRAESRRQERDLLPQSSRSRRGHALSHAHIDHCGNLARGCFAKAVAVLCCALEATADVADIMLLDSVHIQVEDARYLDKHGMPTVLHESNRCTPRRTCTVLARQFERVRYGAMEPTVSRPAKVDSAMRGTFSVRRSSNWSSRRRVRDAAAWCSPAISGAAMACCWCRKTPDDRSRLRHPDFRIDLRKSRARAGRPI